MIDAVSTETRERLEAALGLYQRLDCTLGESGTPSFHATLAAEAVERGEEESAIYHLGACEMAAAMLEQIAVWRRRRRVGRAMARVRREVMLLRIDYLVAVAEYEAENPP